MKFVRWARTLLALCVPCATAALLSSCGGGHTIGYVYAVSQGQTSATASSIYSYGINSDIGGITSIATTSSGGNGVSAALSTHSGSYLFVANETSGTVSSFGITQDSGALGTAASITTPGATPIALATDLNADYLFVLDAYGSGYSAANPGPSALNVYSIGSGGALSLKGTYPVGDSAAGVAALYDDAAVYVTAQTGGTGVVYEFAVGSGGALTSIGTVNCGVTPAGITSEPTNRFIYATDYAQNQVYAYIVGANGSLTSVLSSPFATTSLGPIAITVEPRGKYAYVANYRASTVSAFIISQSSGALSLIANYAAGTGPVSLAVDQLQGTYLYTANNLDNSISAYTLNSSTGVLTGVQNSPFDDVGQHPTAITTAPNGATPTPGNP